MPNASTRQTLTRQWEILKALPRRGAGISVGELLNHLSAQGFEVTERTIQRDLNALTECFPIECNDKGKPYGWRLSESASFDFSGLAIDEASSLYLIEQVITPLLPAAIIKSLEKRFEQARLKLSSVEKAGMAHIANRYRFVSHGWPLLAPSLDEDILSIIQKAVEKSEIIEVAYTSAAQLIEAETSHTIPTPRTMRLHPLALINRGPATYLLATCSDYEDPRLYAVQRISQAQNTHEPARRPENFNLDEWLQQHSGQFGSGESIQLQAIVSPNLAAILRETPLSHDQTLEHSTGCLIATVRDTLQLYWWIMSQGENIEIKSPQQLRCRIIGSLNNAKEIYTQQGSCDAN